MTTFTTFGQRNSAGTHCSKMKPTINNDNDNNSPLNDLLNTAPWPYGLPHMGN